MCIRDRICDVQKMLTQIQETVGFEYIKLCGIFSDDLHIYNETASKVPVYSFSYLDKILDFVIVNHLKPWLQLSYMPEKLAKYPNRRLFGANVSQPHSVSAWSVSYTHLDVYKRQRKHQPSLLQSFTTPSLPTCFCANTICIFAVSHKSSRASRSFVST